MENPLAFAGAALMGVGALDLLLGPLIARTTGMPAGSSRAFVLGGVVALGVGAMLFLLAV